MTTVKIEPLSIPPLTEVGESPHWDVSTQSLYFSDVRCPTIYRYHPGTNKYFSLKLDLPMITFFIPLSNSNQQFVLASHINLYLLNWDGTSNEAYSLEVLHKLENEPTTNKICDGKCDSTGRLWFGTMKIEDFLNGRDSNLYSFKKEEGCKLHLKGLGLCNGITWDSEKHLMYFADSGCKTITALDYNPDGKPENPRTIFDLNEHNMDFIPDGMTIDDKGRLWVAGMLGSCVLNIDPVTGDLLQKIDVPVKYVTSLAWGGPTLEDLFFTTANWGDEPERGRIFRISGLSAKGLPMTNFKL